MKKFFVKVKDWFIAHKPTKRRIIQLYAALLTNANLKGFGEGKIYTGATKQMCVPGLNCYSCPGAVGACPLGALQDSLAQSKTSAPAYIFGILILFGLLLARTICGFLCPVGLFQELLYKIRTPKLRKSRFTRIFSYFKYVLLAIVIAIPLIYGGIPSFCKYVCPAGTLEGAVSLLSNIKNTDLYAMLNYLFTWKFCVLVVLVVASVFIYRFFCRFICPLGAIYSLFNRFAFLGVKLDKNKCIDCGLCIQTCKMDIRHVGDHECIQCGECIPVCPVQAISWKGSQIFVKNTTPLAKPVPEPIEGEKIRLLEIAKSNATVAVIKPEGEETEVLEKTEVSEEIAVSESEPISEGAPPAEVTTAKPKSKALQTVKDAFKKPKFVVEFVAWVLATALLVTALICYNLPEKKHDTVPYFNLKTYNSAVGGEGEYDTSAGSKIKVLYFWRTDMQESVDAMSALNEFYVASGGEVDIVAIHTIYRDNRDVQAFIDGQGWNGYNITFAQDDIENNAYANFGGDISVPKPITLVLSDNLLLKNFGGEIPSAEELTSVISEAKRATVYAVGDLCPLFTLDCYNAAEGTKFSIAESRGKVTVLNFWYTTCDPCKEELPYFESVYKEYGGEINMATIHSYTALPPTGVQNFLDTESDKNGKKWNSYTLTFAQDNADTMVYKMLGGKGPYPVTVILDKDGRITYVKQGSCSEKELRDGIVKAMGDN